MIIRTTGLLFCLIFAGATAQIFGQPRPTLAPARPAATPTQVRPTTTQTPAADVPVPPSRIALIDTEMFGDEKRGIVRYVDAIKSIQPQFAAQNQELQNLQNRMNALAEEIRKLSQAPANERLIQSKREEGGRLRQDFETKRQRLSEDFEKKLQEVTGPISEQIGKAMDQFARERGITMTLDLSKLLPAMLTAIPAVNVTDAFIADFNRKNPRVGPPATRP
ncbi:MAG TPA: OmpH family outer membrane protein [Pyrinomonadaceae bacterium]|nr:OmpH family outer membrane protein [Pyrinomonadaceae bacterium]